MTNKPTAYKASDGTVIVLSTLSCIVKHENEWYVRFTSGEAGLSALTDEDVDGLFKALNADFTVS